MSTTAFVISLLAIVNLSIMTVFCWLKAGRQHAFLWFGFMFFATAMAILNNTTIYTGHGNIIIYHISLFLNVSWGGYMILFVNDLRRSARKTKFKYTYFIPSYIYTLFIIYTLIQPKAGEEILNLAQQAQMNLFSIIFNVVIVFYTIVSNIVLLIREYLPAHAIHNEKPVKLKERKEILWVMLVLQLMAFTPLILALNLEYIILYMPVFGQIFFIYIFFKLSNSSILYSNPVVQYLAESVKKQSVKYANIKLDNSQTEFINKQITEYLESSKSYLKNEFNISALSKELNISSNIISMVINSKAGSNFPDYINSLRIQKATELLKDNKSHKLTIEAIGFECGFNNRTSFYNAFRKHTGKLPTEYIKTIKDMQ